MTKDRLVQLVAAVVAIVALLGSALLVPAVNRQRRDLQLSFDAEAGDRVKPTYAVFAAGLGSFKGLAVNALWYRAEMEKRAGRHAEAYTIAEMITELQPRFPQVWAFHAWNMAYNISVATFTPQERWDWINKGIHLLREEGIRYNPRAVQLYRELSWTLFHKVGQFADDMNWYYKAEVAREWHEVLGGPSDFLPDDALVARMGEIAAVGDRYLMFDRPSESVRNKLDELAADVEAIEQDRDELWDLSVFRLVARLEAVQSDLVREGRVRTAERVGELLDELREAKARAERDPLAVYQEENPEAVPAVQALRGAGFAMDARTLRAIGKLRLYSRYGGPEWILGLKEPLIDDDARAMADVFFANNTPAFQRALEALLPYLRAKVLRDAYNMDPAFMHRVMVEHGPLDWRHPHAHSLYWAAKGLDVATRLRNDEDVDWVNTQRLVVQSIQSLTDYGSVRFNPLLRAGEQVDLMPNPAFADSYGRSLEQAIADAEAGKFGNISIDNFESGHENFLHKAMYLNYFYGSEAEARKHFARARELYADKYHNQFDRRYEQPMEDLLWEFVMEGIDSQAMARAFVAANLRRAYRNELAYGQLNRFDRAMLRTREFYDRYQEQRAYETGYEVRERLALPPFGRLVRDEFTAFMRDASSDLLLRRTAYANAPLPLQQTYRDWIGDVARQLEQSGDAPALASLFPEPPGLEDAPDQPEQGRVDGVATERK